jgi:hypothetical protein
MVARLLASCCGRKSSFCRLQIHSRIDTLRIPSPFHAPALDAAAVTTNLDTVERCLLLWHVLCTSRLYCTSCVVTHQLRDMVARKADVDAVADALDLKANKASVATALHAKLSKDKADVRFSKLEAGFESMQSQLLMIRSTPPPAPLQVVKEVAHTGDTTALRDVESTLSRLRSEVNGEWKPFLYCFGVESVIFCL